MFSRITKEQVAKIVKAAAYAGVSTLIAAVPALIASNPALLAFAPVINTILVTIKQALTPPSEDAPVAPASNGV